MKDKAKLTVGVEVEGGRIVPVMDAEAQAWAHAVFTTSADHQRRADLRIYYREEDSGDWQAVETVVVRNIADCRAGEPDIDFYAEKAPDGTLLVRTQALTPQRRSRSGPARKPLLLLLLAAVLGLAFYFLLRPAALKLPAAGRSPAAVRSVPEARAQELPGKEAALQTARQPLAAEKAAPQPEARSAAQPAERAAPEPEAQAQTPPGQGLDRAPQPAAERQPRSVEREHQIQWGDTLWSITERYYGDRSLYPLLAERNRLANPDWIISGNSLSLPEELGPEAAGESR